MLKKISVVCSEEEYSRFDAYCSRTGHKKSTLIVRLIREHLDREGSGTPRTERGSNNASKMTTEVLTRDRHRGSARLPLKKKKK